MNAALTFILKLQDMLTPGMRQAVAVTNTTASQIDQQFSRVAGSGKRMTASVDELRARLEAVNRVRFSTTVEREFNIATRAAQRLEGQIQRLEGRGRLMGGGGLLGGLAAGFGAYQGISGTIGAAGTREQQQIAFGVMAGSQKAGDKMLADIIKMGAQTPYEAGDLVKNAQTLKAFGIENEKVLPILRMIGDVGAGDAQKLQSLSLAFAQVSSAGKLSGQDLLQMVNAGFNPLQEISKATGLSMAELRKKMEAGAISAGMVEQAFKRATGPGGQFFQMMEKQSKTLNGRWSTFMDNGKEKLLAFGQTLLPLANLVIDFGNGLMNAEPGALALAVAIGGLTLAISGASIATKIMATYQALLNGIMAANPIILIITLIIALGLWIYSLAKKYEGWGKSLQGLWEIIKGFVKLNGIAWKELGENIWYWIQYAWLKVKGFVEWIGGAMGNVFNAIKLASQFKFSEAKAALTAEIKTTASTQIAELEKQHAAGKIKNQQDALAAAQQMQKGWDMVGLKKIADPANAKGVNPNTANAVSGSGSSSGFEDLKSTAKDKADKINSGGSRPIIFNIGKQIENVNMTVMNAQEGAQEIALLIRQEVRKLAYSLNGVTGN